MHPSHSTELAYQAAAMQLTIERAQWNGEEAQRVAAERLRELSAELRDQFGLVDVEFDEQSEIFWRKIGGGDPQCALRHAGLKPRHLVHFADSHFLLIRDIGKRGAKKIKEVLEMAKLELQEPDVERGVFMSKLWSIKAGAHSYYPHGMGELTLEQLRGMDDRYVDRTYDVDANGTRFLRAMRAIIARLSRRA